MNRIQTDWLCFPESSQFCNPCLVFLLFRARELQLALVELAVETVLREQLLVIADLADAPVLRS